MILDDKIISRREFLEKSGLAIATIAGIDALLTNTVFGEEELTLEQIAEEVKTKTVKQILGDKIEVLDYKSYDRKKLEDYDNLMIFVYTEMGQGFLSNRGDIIDFYCLRDAIVFREIAKKYQDTVKFVAYECKQQYAVDDPILRDLDITSSLSIIMLSKKDVLTGKTSNKNFVIDRLRGGPTDDRYIKAWIGGINDTDKGTACAWINLNILKPNGQYTWRLNNSGNPKKYEY